MPDDPPAGNGVRRGRQPRASLAAATALVLTACSPANSRQTDATTNQVETIFTGTFVTLVKERPVVEAVAVDRGRIVAVGSAGELREYEGPSTRRAPLPGTVLPGFADAHIHVLSLGEQLQMLDLRGLSKADILARVAKASTNRADGTWIEGRGWDQGFWSPAVFPTAADLDAVIGDRPVVLTRIDGHSVWANTRALALAGITANTADPDGGRILRDARGQPTGMLIDRAVDRLRRAMPAPTRDAVKARLRLGLDRAVRWGLTSVHDAGVDLETIAIYKELLAASELPLRVYVMAQANGAAAAHYLARGPEVDLGDGRLSVRSFKAMVDGALGSRGAQLSDAYADATSERGIEIMRDADLRRLVREAKAKGFQVNTHAIGDFGVRRVLDAYEEAGATAADRYRIEHASVVAPADLPRFARMGIIASVQPNFVGEYSRWAEDRVGPRRATWIKPTRELLGSRAVVAAGSDYPASDTGDPLITLFSLVTRKGADGTPVNGWFPAQRVPIDAALEAMTAAPAFAAFQADRLGAIAPGRYADFTVLSADPREVPPDDLRSIRVQMTVVAGSPVFEAARHSSRQP